MQDTSLLTLIPAWLGCAIISVEAFLRLPLVANIQSLNQTAVKVVSVIGSARISDHWKERVVPAYARQILLRSLTLAACLLLILLVLVTSWVLLASWPAGGITAALDMLMHWQWHVLVFVAAWAWAMWRTRRQRAAAAAEDYSEGDKFLHRLALASPSTRVWIDDLDQRIAPASVASTAITAPVYVCALARAGTTVLLQALYESGQFTAQTYRAMPFVMAPWTWGGLRKSKHKSKTKQRAHGDALEVGIDSPEAFEEVFWNTRSPQPASDAQPLQETAAPELLERYRGYVRRISARGQRRGESGRYLCKNNNNVLRLPLLRSAFPDALILMPFRDPAAHVQSLLGQHKRFLKRHSQDPFSLEYMDWLGHHEFGAHFRPFRVGPRCLPADAEALLNPVYWVDYWCDVYRFLLHSEPTGVLWWDHDAFVAEPLAYLELLEQKLALPSGCLEPWAEKVSPGQRDILDTVQAAVSDEARELHQQLRARAINPEQNARG
ncbi:MAG: sulfotransferase [Xanthomonadales bacterium]|nr:sulfotransferase [Xanthomonadales bacterium]